MSLPLDAGVRTGGPPAVAARNGLGRRERRQHGNDFAHLDYPGWPSNTLEAARLWAKKIPGTSYAIDDQTAISVVDGAVKVITDGHWEQFSH